MAKSLIRVGTFQYLHQKDNMTWRKELMDYVIKRNFPEITTDRNKYLSLNLAIDAQSSFKMDGVGFIHGVMTTDNCSIIGDTIDYGPYAFMDKYNENTVFSSIDTLDAIVIKTNHYLPMEFSSISKLHFAIFIKWKKKSIKIAQNEIDKYSEVYVTTFLKRCIKIGFSFLKIENDDH